MEEFFKGRTWSDFPSCFYNTKNTAHLIWLFHSWTIKTNNTEKRENASGGPSFKVNGSMTNCYLWVIGQHPFLFIYFPVAL